MLHLSTSQLENLRQLLDQHERTVQTQIRTEAGYRADEPYANLTGEVTDTGDEAMADVIVDTDNAMIGMQLEQLRDIAAARERMKNFRYGICVNCELEIEYERLLAHPTAKRCAACQILHEKTYSSPPHSRL